MITPRNRWTMGAALALASVGAAIPAGSATSELPKFPVPTGRISYKMTGATVTGTSTLIWAESGKKFRSDAVLNMSGMTGGKPAAANSASPLGAGTIKQWTIADGKFLYIHLPMQGQVASRIPQTPERLKQATAGAAVPMSGDDKGKVVGKATLLGKPCEIRETSNYKMWMWKGLPLKVEMATPNLTIVATKVEAPAKLSATAFKVPSGYKIVDQKPAAAAPSAKRPSVPK